MCWRLYELVFLYFIIRDDHLLDNILCTAMSSGITCTQKTFEQLAWEEEDRTFLLEIKWPVAIGLHGLHGGHQR